MRQPPGSDASSISFEGFRSGWFYRAVAIDHEARVLAIAAPFAGRWFSNFVEDTSLAGASARSGPFGIVILHRTLGGMTTLTRAFAAMHALLETGGIAIVSGHNRLRHVTAAAPDVPRATWRGYLREAHAAGFPTARVYVARPDLDVTNLVVAIERASVCEFFRAEAAAARAAGRTRPAWLARWYAHAAPWLESSYIVVARKC